MLMNKLYKNQKGAVDPLVFPFTIAVVIALILGAFGFYSYAQLGDAQNNVDQKVADALEAERAVIRAEETEKFAEREKAPYRTYQSSSSLSSIVLKYPKTWSSYVEEGGRSSIELSAYFHPGYVRGASSDTLVATRLELRDKSFAETVKTYQKKVDEGLAKASAITVSGAKGLKVTGNFEKKLVGTLVAVPVRDKTIVVWTESADFNNDFNNIVIANLEFNN